MALVQTPSDRYERKVAQDAVITLHQLCAMCTKLRDSSSLLRAMFKGGSIKLGTKEVINLCSPEELEAGYLGGCHLCALLWERARGYLFIYDKPAIENRRVNLVLRARNWELEYELQMQREDNSLLKSMWSRISPPYIGDKGVIVFDIPALGDYKKKGLDVNDYKASELFVYPASNSNISRASLRDGDEPVSSKNSIKVPQIKSWYKNCLENHQKCKDFSQMVAPTDQLPSRLLDLDDNKIKLECKVDQLPQLQYTTLSHMWGLDPDACLQLKVSLLEDFKTDIPENLLPTKYLEAIRLTRALGFRYIWIDSLCIIQDCPEDWKHEALKMATVYGRTSCNISYVFPPSSDADTAHLRDPRIDLPCQLTQPNSPASQPLVVQHTPGPLTRFWSPNTYKTTWPLLSRAWVFQERLLCPRNIYYGPSHLLWECCETLQDEFYGTLANSPRSKSRFHGIFSATHTSQRGREFGDNFRGQWHLLVQDYRQCILTFEKDRIIAFAGIVKAVQVKAKYTYLAGIWKEFAEIDLLWVILAPCVEADREDFCKKRDELRKSTPSWSWFAVPPHSEDTVDFRMCTIMYVQSNYTLRRSEIIHYDHPKLHQGPDTLLHDFVDLTITLRARKIPAQLEWDEGTLRLLPFGKYVLGQGSWMIPKNAMQYVHDDVALEAGSALPADTHMVLTILKAWNTRDQKEYEYKHPELMDESELPVSRTSWQYAGLVVVPDGDSRWRRIGVFLFSDYTDGAQRFSCPFTEADAVEEDVVLV